MLVTNTVQEGSPHATALENRIAWLRQFDDVRQAYTRALENAYREEADGGLGIVRVAYEGRCQVDCDLSKKGQVTVTARCDRPPPTVTGAAAISESQ